MRSVGEGGGVNCISNSGYIVYEIYDETMAPLYIAPPLTNSKMHVGLYSLVEKGLAKMTHCWLLFLMPPLMLLEMISLVHVPPVLKVSGHAPSPARH